MIDKEELDAVDICTPNKIHSIAAVYALENGLHVLCEKPDAVSVAEAEKMKKASEESGKTLMVIRNNRFRPSTKFMKQFIAEGKMGEIYAGRCGWIRRRGIPGWGGWFTDKEQSGGGPLIDLGVHIIDLTMYLMGNAKPVTVSGSTYKKFDTPHIPRWTLRTLLWALSVLTTVLAYKLSSLGLRILQVIKYLLSFVAKRRALALALLTISSKYSQRNTEAT
jgi:predicted dehydrogenase